MHTCFTSDGVAVACLCARGQDHDESQYDRPVGEDK